MRPISLTLKGFRGIRDGLGLDVLTLDFEARCEGAAIVALVGQNGRGKSTVLDNLHPYLAMPSRTGGTGAGGFSYYDHVVLPENEKTLTWEQGGRCFRAQVVIRLAGRRRTEAFLFERDTTGKWSPVSLEDGTVADGKVETYMRCVESLCGSSEAFFMAVFGAQGKRQLSDLRNAEVKSLLADLLGQDEIRALGAKALEAAKLLRSGLTVIRQEAKDSENEDQRLCAAEAAGAASAARAAQALAAEQTAAAALAQAQQRCAALVAEREGCRAADAHRAQVLSERDAAVHDCHAATGRVGALRQAEEDRLARLEVRAQQRSARVTQQRAHWTASRTRAQAQLEQQHRIRWAVGRAPLADKVLRLRVAQVEVLREATTEHGRRASAVQLLEQRNAAIEREAGQAALRAQALAQKFSLAAAVPCRGMALQASCHLLGDARQAQALIPDANHVLRRVARQKEAVEKELRVARAEADALAGAASRLQRAEVRLEHSRQRASRLALLAAKAEGLQGAQERLAEAVAALAGLDGGTALDLEARADEEDRAAIAAAVRALDDQRGQVEAEFAKKLRRLDTVLAGLAPPFDADRLVSAQAAARRAQEALVRAQQAHTQAQQASRSQGEIRARRAALQLRRAELQARTERVESAIGDWTLFARCMSNDGLIALAIGDAGPALSALANDLLLACYGPRFTVSIATQSETAKGELREDFDIVVHDAESGQDKSMRYMSGGERVWINECLVRAVALYLAQTSERRYQTLFSDETDGPLDPERKRMFGAMKREVLRLGGYEREFFISQSAELASMADLVIDLDAMACSQH
ncbi:DNA repair protein [Pseudorhodoferax sp.]|uniref:DNA repair protein n=1 Tax=Pseudorhodoferax sp. TaxID=1993553 RepID=UPI002DD68E5B|nr:DNA repair protein [Pseudorhodoferax sp.]